MSKVENAQLISPENIPSPQIDDKQYRRLGLIVLGLLVGIFGVWGALAPLSGAVSAPGKVSVAFNNRVIQHFEGGIVKEILVKDGDIVKANQPLINLDNTQAEAQLQIILAQYYENLALESRLIAERDGAKSVSFNSQMSEMMPVSLRNITMEAQRREFSARAQQLTDEKRVLLEQIEQIHNQIEGLKATVVAKTSLLNSYNDEIKEWEILYQQQLIDKIRMRDIKREKVRTEGEIASAKAEIGRTGAQISEINAQIIAQKQKFNKEVAAQLSEVQTHLADNRARLSALRDTLNRTKIVAPVDGIVANLQVHTVGGVTPAGKPVLEIVPNSEALIIEGKLAATDITYAHTGLKAEIRFPGFAHIKSLKVVMGEVIKIAPDAMVDEGTKSLYYPVKVRVTAEGQAELLRNHLAIQPGVPTDMMIVTTSRTFMDYMIHPFKNMLIKAFNEQ